VCVKLLEKVDLAILSNLFVITKYIKPGKNVLWDLIAICNQQFVNNRQVVDAEL
jgi:hypothetical protein